MHALAPWLLASGAVLLLVFGLIHLAYTFRGNMFHPRDDTLTEKMKIASPVISRETTMWKAWIGFNASHSFGAIFFGLIYGYLALAHGAFLFAEPVLLAFGLLLLIGYNIVARLYWFTIPRRGITVATMLYVAAIVLHRM